MFRAVFSKNDRSTLWKFSFSVEKAIRQDRLLREMQLRVSGRGRTDPQAEMISERVYPLLFPLRFYGILLRRSRRTALRGVRYTSGCDVCQR